MLSTFPRIHWTFLELLFALQVSGTLPPKSQSPSRLNPHFHAVQLETGEFSTAPSLPGRAEECAQGEAHVFLRKAVLRVPTRGGEGGACLSVASGQAADGSRAFCLRLGSSAVQVDTGLEQDGGGPETPISWQGYCPGTWGWCGPSLPHGAPSQYCCQCHLLLQPVVPVSASVAHLCPGIRARHAGLRGKGRFFILLQGNQLMASCLHRPGVGGGKEPCIHG